MVTVAKGSAVEVSSHEAGFQGAWYVATLVDQVEAGYLVTYDGFVEDDKFIKLLTEVVDPSFVRPIPPRNIRRNDTNHAKEVVEDDDGVGDFEVCDVVDAYHRDGWRPGVVKDVITQGGAISKYVVKFENPFEDFVFEKSKLRFHVDWVDSRWMVPPKKTASEQSEALITDDAQLKSVSSNSSVDGSLTYSRKRFQSSTGSKGNTKFIVSVLEANGSHQDSSSVEHETVITNTHTREASHRRRKRARPQKFVVNKPIDGHEVSTEIDEQPLPSLKRSSCSSCSKNDATVTSGPETNTDYQQDWPFIKRSPLWVTVESYLKPPQKPHFSPLKKMRKEYREGLAIGHIVTYANLVKMVSDKGMQLKDPVDMINSHLETLCVLQTHGFDVGSIRERLKELLSLKSTVGEHVSTRKEVENELEVCNQEKSLVEEERNELEVKMRALKELMDKNAAMHKTKEEEIVRLQSKLDLVSSEINDWVDAFGKLVGSPL